MDMSIFDSILIYLFLEPPWNFYSFSLSLLLGGATSWTELKPILQGRDPIIMDGMTRIVGYFSKTSNWNQSKTGELMDRRKGNYKINTEIG